MKKTVPLSLRPSAGITEDTLAIHPNEGFDLGMMMTAYRVQFSFGPSANDFAQGQDGESCPMEVQLRNQCPLQTIEINQKFWQKLGKPRRAILHYDGRRLLLETL